jgi:t-SNARE complex subunit (syntaxin)
VYTIRQIGISDIQYEPCENDDASDSEQILDEEEIYIVQEELCEKIRRSIDSFSERAKLLKKLLKTCSSKNMANISILHDALEKTTQLEF